MCVAMHSVRSHHPQARAGNLFRCSGTMLLLIQHSSSYVGGVFGTVMFSSTLPKAHSTLFVVDLHIDFYNILDILVMELRKY
jgi:hypothetical protein